MWNRNVARTARLPELVTGRELAAAGLDRDVARRATATGTWTCVLPGAWLRSGRPPTRRARQEAALALLGPGSQLTGVDACLLHGLRDVPDDPRVSVLVPADLRRDLGPEVRLLRTATLPAPLSPQGLRAAPPERAVLDAARGWRSLQDVRALVLAAVADGWIDPESARTALDAGPRRGSGACRRALDDALRGAASAPEAEVADAVRRATCLPPAVLNAELWLGSRLLGRPDGWLLGTGVGWEVDSRRHHGSSDDLDRTLLRHDAFARAGVVLLHVTPRRFRVDPAAFVRELADRVRERRAAGLADPPGLVLVPRTERG